MFELVKERCNLAHVNVRSELHGDEKQTAYDVKFSVSLANSVLLKFHPELRDAFYKQGENKDIDPEFVPNLKFPLIRSISWDLEIPRTKLIIHDEFTSKDVVLGGGRTNNFQFKFKEGGTVEMTFRCQFSEADPEDIARMLSALGQIMPISLESVEIEEEPDKFQQADLLNKEPMSGARQEAEAAFSNFGKNPAVVESFQFPEKEANVTEITTKKRGRKIATNLSSIE